jgi:hypothetical protein
MNRSRTPWTFGWSSHDLYDLIAFLDDPLKSGADDGCMDLIAIVLALGVFALLALAIEAADRV